LRPCPRLVWRLAIRYDPDMQISRIRLSDKTSRLRPRPVNADVRVFAGYSLLYWTGLVRPGGAIDTTINRTQIGGPLAGPARPEPQSNSSDYWAQGLNLGATYRF
jgi:hypothetical protein